jgi:glyoxylase-like metal-dependent hydrolase (beta-lactamase superfamily II)
MTEHSERNPGGHPKLTRNVAPGIHRLAHAYVNCYLVEDGSVVTVVDAGLPATWPHLLKALRAIGRSVDDVRAIVITHAHFDHIGFAARAVKELSLPVWVHPRDHYIAGHPYRYQHERPRVIYPLKFPAAIPVLAAMVGAGAMMVPGLQSPLPMPTTGVLEVPGSPRIVFTPGHTAGHCALHFPDRDALLSGDALVTLDPYKGKRGPQIIAGAATADSREAIKSLSALAETEATRILPGHGEPFKGGARAAVAAAVTAGPS